MSESEAGLTEIPAREILNKIQKGEPVVYDHVRVTGDLDVNVLDLPTKHFDRIEDLGKILGLSEECKVVSASIKITNSVFNGKVNFNNTLFKDSINLKNTTFSGDVDFIGAIFDGDAKFIEDTFDGHANFNGAKFVYISFERTTFRFYAVWGYATFNGEVKFDEAKFERDFVSFEEAVFVFPNSEENACRRAKSVLAKAGDRYREDYYFYREMVAKRKQNSLLGGHPVKRFIYYDFIEQVFIQKIFGYGVHPLRLIMVWVAVIIVSCIIYYSGNEVKGITGLIHCMAISFATAIAPGYTATVIQPIQSGDQGFHLGIIYKVVAALETIMGTFLWAGFIATFVRRYMR